MRRDVTTYAIRQSIQKVAHLVPQLNSVEARRTRIRVSAKERDLHDFEPLA